MCFNCSQEKIESTHATMLKQVLRYKYGNNVVWEDESCVYNNRILKTDIVNHKEKWVIEVNGEQHYEVNSLIVMKSKSRDINPKNYFKYQQEKDNFKKNFWINEGYRFIEIDIRNKTPLDILKEYIDEDIRDIPNYVDLTGKVTKTNWDRIYAQILLNEGYRYKEIAEIVGTTYSAINSAVHHGILTKKCV